MRATTSLPLVTESWRDVMTGFRTVSVTDIMIQMTGRARSQRGPALEARTYFCGIFVKVTRNLGNRCQ